MSTSLLTSDFKNIFFCIQARLSSARLPEKVLKTIGNDTLIDHIINRLLLITPKENILFAIPHEDDKLSALIEKREIKFVTGDNKNVLSRFFNALSGIDDKSIVFRITADNPFIDTQAILMLASQLIKTKDDYAHTKNIPLGMGCEAFRKDALWSLKDKKLSNHHKEHVTVYFREYKDEFNISTVQMHDTDYSKLIRMTVDEENDLKMAKKVFDYFHKAGNIYFNSHDVIQLFEQDPSFFNINRSISQKSEFVYER